MFNIVDPTSNVNLRQSYKLTSHLIRMVEYSHSKLNYYSCPEGIHENLRTFALAEVSKLSFNTEACVRIKLSGKLHQLLHTRLYISSSLSL